MPPVFSNFNGPNIVFDWAKPERFGDTGRKQTGDKPIEPKYNDFDSVQLTLFPSNVNGGSSSLQMEHPFGRRVLD
ncbi:hypothetical protein Pfo_000150 [Paulownia fortunei]|nr:hypothetical protein Pfo_000150 [Paulownia fortunei]